MVGMACPHLWLSLASLFLATVDSVSIWSVGKPQGHVDIREDVPSPREFYHDYLRNSGGPFEGVGKPVLFQGAAKKMPAYDLWTDKYLRETHGKIIMDQVETEKKETRTALPHEDWNLAKFLDHYNTSDIYSTASTPKGLSQELYLLPFMNCGGGFTKRLAESVLWFSSGDTKSVIHADNNHNIHCIIAGEKRWMMWRPDSKIDTKAMGWIRGEKEAEKDPNFKDAYGTYAGKIDVDNVDLQKYPRWDKLKWWNMTMRAGDCAFIPAGWFHFVEAPRVRTISVHVWFGAAREFNDKSCEALRQKGVDPDKNYLASFQDCKFGWGGEGSKKASTCKLKLKKSEL